MRRSLCLAVLGMFSCGLFAQTHTEMTIEDQIGGRPTVNIANSPSGATQSGITVTITTTAPCSFVTGQPVAISLVGVGGYNGNWTVATGCNGGSTFTYYTYQSSLAASGGGSVVGSPIFTGQLANTTGLLALGTGLRDTKIAPRLLSVSDGSWNNYLTGQTTFFTPSADVTRYEATVQTAPGFGPSAFRAEQITFPGVDVQSGIAGMFQMTANSSNSVGSSIDNNVNQLAIVGSCTLTGSTNCVAADFLTQGTYSGTGTQLVQAIQNLGQSVRNPVWFGNPNGAYASVQANLWGPDPGASYKDLTYGTAVDGNSGRGFLFGEFIGGAKQVAHAVLPSQADAIIPDIGYWGAAAKTSAHWIGARLLYPTNSDYFPNYSTDSPVWGHTLGEKAANNGQSNTEVFLSTSSTTTSCTLLASPNGASQSGYIATYTCNAAITFTGATTATSAATATQIAHITGVTNTGYNIDCAILTVSSPSFTCLDIKGYDSVNRGLAASGGGTVTVSTVQAWAQWNDSTGTHNFGYASPPSGNGTTRFSISNASVFKFLNATNTPLTIDTGATDIARISGGGTANGINFFQTTGTKGLFQFYDDQSDNNLLFQLDGANSLARFAVPLRLDEVAAPSGVASKAVLWADSTAHKLKVNNNNGGAVTLAYTDTAQTFSAQQALSSNNAVLTADFTDANASGFQTITGLGFTLAANTAQNVPFECDIMYSQATVVSDSFGIQDVTIAPTRIDAGGTMGTSTTAFTFGNLANLTTTTATAIVTAAPTVTTVNSVHLSGVIQQPSNASSSAINIMVSQSTAANVIVIKAGSRCKIW